MELDPADLGIEALDVFPDGPCGVLVPVRRRKLEQLGRVPESGVGPVDRVDDALEADPLAPEGLRPLRIAPDRGVLQLAPNRGEAFSLRGNVKDTPKERSCALEGPGCASPTD